MKLLNLGKYVGGQRINGDGSTWKILSPSFFIILTKYNIKDIMWA